MKNQTRISVKVTSLFIFVIMIVGTIPVSAQKTFKETLKIHLDAIRHADLKSFEPTVGDSIVHITPIGELNKSKVKFMKVHEDWFKTRNWEWQGDVVESTSNETLGNALIKYTYIQKDTAGKVTFQIQAYLVLIFQKINGNWQLIHDQNTGISSRT